MAKSKAKRPGAKASGRVKKSVILPAQLARQLAAAAAWDGRSESDLVAEALEPLLGGSYFTTRRESAPAPGQELPPETDSPALRVA